MMTSSALTASPPPAASGGIPLAGGASTTCNCSCKCGGGSVGSWIPIQTPRRYILYGNIGSLPKVKAQEFIEDSVKLFRGGENPWLRDFDKIIGLPTTGDTRLEEYEY